MNSLLLIILVVICVVVIIFTITLIAVYKLFYVPNILRYSKPMKGLDASNYYDAYADVMKKGKDWFLSMKPEEVSVKSFDGLNLKGYYLIHQNARASILLVHGFHGNGVDDFASIYQFLYELGLNVLVIDQRTHGMSEGKHITFGIKERYDVKTWVEFLNIRNGNDFPVFIDGVSMGCASVLMSIGLNLPKNVKAIIADCGFTSPYEILKSILRTHVHMPDFPIIPCASILTRVLAGFGIKEYSTIEAMKVNTIPTVFIHGEKDSLVPIEMTFENYKACNCEKYIYTTKDADHAMSYLVDTQRYNDLMSEFLLSRC